MPVPHTELRALGYSLLLVAALLPFSAAAKCQVQSFEIPVTMKEGRAIAQLGVNGTEMPFAIDSGAFHSILSPAAAAQLNLRLRTAPVDMIGATGRVDELYIARVERLGLQGVELKDVEFLVGGREVGAGAVGVIGRNLLSASDAEYDLANRMVRLMRPNEDCEKANLAYWAEGAAVEVPLIVKRGEKAPAIKTQAMINGKRVTLFFDTGANSILSLDAAKRLGLIDDETRLEPSGTFTGWGREERPWWTVPMQSFELGDERITNSRVQVAELDGLDGADMVIGMDFFLSHRIYVARSQYKLLFTYTGGPIFDPSIKTDTPVAAQDEQGGANTPRDAEGFALRGMTRMLQGQERQALHDLDRAVELAPTVSKYRALRTSVRSYFDQPVTMADLDEVLRVDPTTHNVRVKRAFLLGAEGRMDELRADLQFLDQRVGPRSNLRRDMGGLYLMLAEPTQAIRQYDQWVDSHGKDANLPSVLNSRCWARALAAVDLDKALDDCERALRAQPDNTAFLDSRGLVYVRLGRWDDAIADYDAALKQKPTQTWSLWGRGLAHLRSGAHEQGLADIAAAKAATSSIEADARRYGLEVPENLSAAGKP